MPKHDLVNQKPLAVIPARGGSKRLPGKNIKNFLGKPIIQYSIDAALKSNLFEKVIVSTDSEEIAGLAKKLGAEAPFVRPQNLSDDFVSVTDVFLHAIEWYQQSNNCDEACLILATAPFVQEKYLKESLELLKKTEATAVVPVTHFDYPIFRSLKMGAKNRLEMFWPEHEMTRSNDLPEAYHDAGQFYWVNVAKFMKQKKLLLPDSVGYSIPKYMVQDIDTMEDWERAEIMYKAIFKV